MNPDISMNMVLTVVVALMTLPLILVTSYGWVPAMRSFDALVGERVDVWTWFKRSRRVARWLTLPLALLAAIPFAAVNVDTVGVRLGFIGMMVAALMMLSLSMCPNTDEIQHLVDGIAAEPELVDA